MLRITTLLLLVFTFAIAVVSGCTDTTPLAFDATLAADRGPTPDKGPTADKAPPADEGTDTAADLADDGTLPEDTGADQAAPADQGSDADAS